MKYIFKVKELLQNPVYNALLSGDKYLSHGDDNVKFFDEEVSPFVGFHKNYSNGFADLYKLMPLDRRILYATTEHIDEPAGWELKHEVEGLQFVYEAANEINHNFDKVKPLGKEHVDQMLNLATVTRPGPFGLRTIDFGSYYGIFDADKLVAMTGERLHVHNHTEISAVCTLPEYTGKGYANTLLLHQTQLILQQGLHPFLHVRADNERAIALYKRIGFTVSSQMNFYFMKRK